MKFVIRPCTDADVPAIWAIYAAAVIHGTASFELEPPALEEMQRRRAALIKGGYPYFVAERDGAIQGYTYAGPYHTRPGYRSTVEDSIYVAPESQGQGVGRALLEELIRACEALDFRRMIAVIGDRASAGSIALHRSCGFQHVGVLEGVGYKHGRWLDSVLMQRGLRDGGSTPPTRPIPG